MYFTIVKTSTIAKMMRTIEELKSQNAQLQKEKEDAQKRKTNEEEMKKAMKESEEKMEEMKEELEALRDQNDMIHTKMRFYVGQLNNERMEMMNKMEEEKERAEHFKKEFLLLENKVKSGQLTIGSGQMEDVPVNIPTCQICVRPYSTSNIDLTPRSLDCGHTLCEECAKEIMRMAGKKDICCPFDRKWTKLSKGVTGLPKNYAILDLVNNL